MRFWFPMENEGMVRVRGCGYSTWNEGNCYIWASVGGGEMCGSDLLRPARSVSLQCCEVHSFDDTREWFDRRQGRRSRLDVAVGVVFVCLKLGGCFPSFLSRGVRDVALLPRIFP